MKGNSRLAIEIGNLIQKIDYIVPTHVRRSGNVAEDNLSNWGCQHAGNNLDIRVEELGQIEGMTSLEEILRTDKEKGENR